MTSGDPPGDPADTSPRERADTAIERRKRDHLRVVLSEDVGFASLTTGLERMRVMPRALPERDLDQVDLSLTLWGRALRFPLLISCMTGGTSEAGPVNRALAAAAARTGVALGLGSGRAILRGADASSYRVRDVAPETLVMANLGAVQLREHTAADCLRLVEACEADVLVLHANAVQEAVQPGGDATFGGLLERIAHVCDELPVPVVVKEVGFGLSPADVGALIAAGVAGVDVAGAGGTNWARVEGQRDEGSAAIAAAFTDWGLPTADAVRGARQALDTAGSDAVLLGSGGLRDGVDALKVLCLGADVAGFARGLLRAASEGPEAASVAVAVVARQLQVAAWAAGAASGAQLGIDLLT